MFPLVDAGFLLVVPVRAEGGHGEGLMDSIVRGGMLLQKPLMLVLVETW